MKRPNRSQRTQPDLLGTLCGLRQLTKIILPSSYVYGSAARRVASIEEEEGAMNRTLFVSPVPWRARWGFFRSTFG
jgi:hypothetical protein